MDKYFAYQGHKGLDQAKREKVHNTKFHLGSVDVAIRRCNRIFGEGNYKLYKFQDFNNNDTYEMIV